MIARPRREPRNAIAEADVDKWHGPPHYYLIGRILGARSLEDGRMALAAVTRRHTMQLDRVTELLIFRQ